MRQIRGGVGEMIRDLEFPWWCVQGCYAAMFCSDAKVLHVKGTTIKYDFWTCPKCGNTVRVCVWRRRMRKGKPRTAKKAPT